MARSMAGPGLLSQILTALLDRLDAAVAKAIYDGIFTAEVNR